MDTAISRRDWVGRVIDGRFPLREWLGDSESGSVFLTELEGPGSSKAAIKLIPAEACDAEARLELWNQASALSHPHLLRLFCAGRCPSHTGELLYAVMEFAEENLAQILPERPLTPAESGEMLAPILDALAYLHGRGLVQASLKPSNVLAVQDQIKLSCDRLQRASASGDKNFSPRIYDAPECSRGTVTPAADLWALGVTLVEALSQHPPRWERSGVNEPEVPESLSQPYREIARGCLCTDPMRRYTLPQVKNRLKSRSSFSQIMVKIRWPLLAAALLLLIAIISLRHMQSLAPVSSQPAQDQQTLPETNVPSPSASAPASLPASQSSYGGRMNGAIVEQVLPDVPAKASSTIHGRVEVTVRVTTDKNGGVASAEPESLGSSKYFTKLAVEAARRWRFKPARVDGRAVSSQWILHFHFEPAETTVTPVEAVP
jgi:TonB family protein